MTTPYFNSCRQAANVVVVVVVVVKASGPQANVAGSIFNSFVFLGRHVFLFTCTRQRLHVRVLSCQVDRHAHSRFESTA